MKRGNYFIKQEGEEWWVYDLRGIVVATWKIIKDAITFAETTP